MLGTTLPVEFLFLDGISSSPLKESPFSLVCSMVSACSSTIFPMDPRNSKEEGEEGDLMTLSYLVLGGVDTYVFINSLHFFAPVFFIGSLQ
jgi:hypothetical protein